jgi:hypothetical protein
MKSILQYLFTCLIVCLLANCQKTQKTVNSNNNSNPNPGSGSNGTTASSCGPFNQNVGNSGGASNSSNYPADIIDLTSGTSGQPIKLCSTQSANTYIGIGITFVQISYTDTLFLWSSPNGYALVSSYVSSDTIKNSDHIEYLADVKPGNSSGGNINYYALRNLASGYKPSAADLGNYKYTYSNVICLSYTTNNNSIGSFRGKTGYIAFRIGSNNNFEYGWLKVQLTNDFTLSVYELVINTTNNTPITIGQYQ